jgi:hypothetical protein
MLEQLIAQHGPQKVERWARSGALGMEGKTYIARLEVDRVLERFARNRLLWWDSELVVEAAREIGPIEGEDGNYEEWTNHPPAVLHQTPTVFEPEESPDTDEGGFWALGPGEDGGTSDPRSRKNALASAQRRSRSNPGEFRVVDRYGAVVAVYVGGDRQ